MSATWSPEPSQLSVSAGQSVVSVWRSCYRACLAFIAGRAAKPHLIQSAAVYNTQTGWRKPHQSSCSPSYLESSKNSFCAAWMSGTITNWNCRGPWEIVWGRMCTSTYPSIAPSWYSSFWILLDQRTMWIHPFAAYCQEHTEFQGLQPNITIQVWYCNA